MTFPLPENETARLDALLRCCVLDTAPEKAFDDLTLLAAQICQTPIALVSLIDERRQWFKARVGFGVTETPREIAFCVHAIMQSHLFVVPDAQADEKFATNPLVTSEPCIRFYAGAPLITPEGHALGALCVMDHVPRELSAQQKEALNVLARQVVVQLELRRNVVALAADIAQRERAEKSLRELEERYRLLTEATSDGIITIDRAGTILCANTAAENIFGYAAEKLVGANLTMLTPDYLGHMRRAVLKRYAEVGGGRNSWAAVELHGLHRSGREIPLKISFVEFVRDGERCLTGIIRNGSETINHANSRGVPELCVS